MVGNFPVLHPSPVLRVGTNCIQDGVILFCNNSIRIDDCTQDQSGSQTIQNIESSTKGKIFVINTDQLFWFICKKYEASTLYIGVIFRSFFYDSLLYILHSSFLLFALRTQDGFSTCISFVLLDVLSSTLCLFLQFRIHCNVNNNDDERRIHNLME